MRWMILVMNLVFGRVWVRFAKIFFAPESHGHQTRHIERGAGRGNRADDPQQPSNGNVSSRNSPPENLIFGPEATKRNDAADGQPSSHKREIGPGHVLAKPAHLAHVLFVMHAVDHAAGAQKH